MTVTGEREKPPVHALETALAAVRAVLRQPALLALSAAGLALIEAAISLYGLMPSGQAVAVEVFGLLVAGLIAVHLSVAYLWMRAQLAPRGRQGPQVRRAVRFGTFCMAILLVLAVAGNLALLVAGFGGSLLIQADVLSRAAGQSLSVAVALAGLVVLVWLFARMSFVLPAAAIERRGGFVLSWRQTRGRGLRLAGAILIGLWPMVLAFIVAQWLNRQGGLQLSEAEAVAFFLFRGACRALSTILIASAVVHAYRALGHADDPALAHPAERKAGLPD
ncbi:hypothetical protein [Futiania mangrovi]|uniref:Uncharacterized protein n=1 Tax=Futiania mangrovi TaxID=2959716 RepID=A0A9J6PHK3_9PROT|nr:hypothetical protein [Futiania mangrovii]MCP1337296.1 hypothetical protein [Futiania mangrovii]